jgi:hypothetical protein
MSRTGDKGLDEPPNNFRRVFHWLELLVPLPAMFESSGSRLIGGVTHTQPEDPLSKTGLTVKSWSELSILEPC